jgi:hypothetical protein
VSPAEAKKHLVELAGELLEYVDEPEALEFRQSINHARNIDAATPEDEPESQPTESTTLVPPEPSIAEQSAPR